MVIVLVTGAIAVAIVQERLAYERLDGELERLMLTLEGVMRTEFGEGLDLIAAADEASIEVVAPDRTLCCSCAPMASCWRSGGGRSKPRGSPHSTDASLETPWCGIDAAASIEPACHASGTISYVAAVMAPLDGIEAEHRELLARAWRRRADRARSSPASADGSSGGSRFDH